MRFGSGADPCRAQVGLGVHLAAWQGSTKDSRTFGEEGDAPRSGRTPCSVFMFVSPPWEIRCSYQKWSDGVRAEPAAARDINESIL